MTMMPPPPIAVPFVAEPSMWMVRSYELQSLASLYNAHVLSFSVSPDFASSSSKTWFPVCSQGGRSTGVISGCVSPKIDLQTSLVVFLQLVFFVRWWTSTVAICLLGFVSAIQRDFSMAMVLSCVALVATVGRSTSAKIASAGVVLTYLVIALPAYL